MRVLAALVVVVCVLTIGANAQDHWKKAVRPSGLGGKAPASESAHSTLSAAGEFVVAGKTGQEVLSALHLVVPGAIAHLAKQPAKAKTSSAEYLGGHFATVAGLIHKSSVKPSPKASAVVSLSSKDLSVSELATAVKLANAGAKPAFRFAEAANAGAHHSSADKKIAAHRAKSEASHGSSSSAKVFVVVVKASGKPRFAHHSSADKKIAAHRAKSESAKHSGSTAAWKVTAATKPIKGLVHPNLFVVDEHYNVVAAPSAAELKKKL